jgi:hypothetical protein
MSDVTSVALLVLASGCAADDAGSVDAGSGDDAAMVDEATRGGDETAATTGPPPGKDYCGGTAPSEVEIGRAFTGSGTLQIELASPGTGTAALLCDEGYPGCNAQWESLVPIPDARPGEYDPVDVLHREYFAPDTCGGPSPDHSEAIDGTALRLYEVQADCVSGALVDAAGTMREFVAEICGPFDG